MEAVRNPGLEQVSHLNKDGRIPREAGWEGTIQRTLLSVLLSTRDGGGGLLRGEVGRRGGEQCEEKMGW